MSLFLPFGFRCGNGSNTRRDETNEPRRHRVEIVGAQASVGETSDPVDDGLYATLNAAPDHEFVGERIIRFRTEAFLGAHR